MKRKRSSDEDYARSPAESGNAVARIHGKAATLLMCNEELDAAFADVLVSRRWQKTNRR